MKKPTLQHLVCWQLYECDIFDWRPPPLDEDNWRLSKNNNKSILYVTLHKANVATCLTGFNPVSVAYG